MTIHQIHTKLKWFRFALHRRIRLLEGQALIDELQETLTEIKEKKYDQHGIFRQFMVQIQDEIAELKKKPKLKTRQYDPFEIKRSGDGRIVLFGLSNAGKSSLMNEITNTNVKTGNYLHTTKSALAGTCDYNHLKIQLVDVPGFIDYREDWNISKQILRVTRTCDAILLVIDLTMDVKKQYQFLMKMLHTAKIIIPEEQTLFKVGIVVTKGDLPKSQDNYEVMKTLSPYDIIPISIKNPTSLMQLKEFLYNLFDVIQIYTKAPHKKVNPDTPLICPSGATIEFVAKKIHKDFLRLFKYARVWGNSVNVQGKHVGLTHELHEKDIVELVIQKK